MTIHRRLLGLDFGTKRVGVAVSDPTRVIATGVTVLVNRPGIFDEIARIAQSYEVETIVVGMPFTLKGEKGQKAQEVESFIAELEMRTGCKVIAWDERFSSHTAHETMRALGVKKKQRQSKSAIDRMASAIILQAYLDASKP